VRTIPPGAGARIEIESALAAAPPSGDVDLGADAAAELLAVDGFVRRPPPELRVCRLDAGSIEAAATRVTALAAAA
jgi:hypothetical protein